MHVPSALDLRLYLGAWTHFYRPSPNRAVNTLRLGLKNQSVNALRGTNRCFFSEIHTKHINTVWAERRIVKC